MWKRMVAGGISGAMGALSCNPFELIKTRSQAQSEHGTHSTQFQSLQEKLFVIKIFVQ
jgi:hypothetical protein